MNLYHAKLVQFMQEEPPPGYSRTSVIQLLRADRAAFTRMAQTVRSLKRNADGSRPLDAELSRILQDPQVCFHLLPLPLSGEGQTKRKEPALEAAKHSEQSAPKKGKGKSKGGGKSKNKLRVPKELVGKAHETPSGGRICWSYNLPSGCSNAANDCPKGAHVCAEPGCFQAHPSFKHKKA